MITSGKNKSITLYAPEFGDAPNTPIGRWPVGETLSSAFYATNRNKLPVVLPNEFPDWRHQGCSERTYDRRPAEKPRYLRLIRRVQFLVLSLMNSAIPEESGFDRLPSPKDSAR